MCLFYIVKEVLLTKLINFVHNNDVKSATDFGGFFVCFLIVFFLWFVFYFFTSPKVAFIEKKKVKL